MSELGSYYITIIPSLQGAAKQIEAELRGVDAAGAGKTIGQNVSRSVGNSLDFKAVGQRLQDIGSQVSDLGGALTKYITVPLGGATVAAAGLVSVLGWKRLTSIDTAQGQLRGLGYEADDISRITSQLTTDLEGGMMDMGQATFAAAGAMAAGVSEGQELTKHIQTLDAAGVASTGTLEEMTELFTRVADEGTLSADVYDMLARRVTGFSSAMQESTGATGQEFRDMLNNGEISYAEFVDVMDAHAGDMATSHAETMEGMIQNTLAWIGVLGESLLGGVFEQSKDSLSEFIDIISSDEAIEKAAEIGAVIADVFGSVISVVGSAISWFMNLNGTTQKLLLSIAGIAIAAGPVLLVVGKIISVIGVVIGAIGKLLASPLGKFIAGVVARSGLLNSALVFLGNVFLRILGPIGLAIGALVALWNNSEVFRQGVMDLAAHVWEALQSIGAEFMRLWTEGIQPILALLAPAAESAFGFFQTWVLPVIEFVFGMIFSIVKGVIDNVVGVISGIVDVITGVVSLVTAIFTGDWAAAWDAVKQIVSGAVSAVWNFIQLWIVGRVLGILRGFGGTLRSLWSGLWNWVRSLVSGAVNGVRSAVSTGFNAVRNVISSVMNGVRSISGNAWNAVRSGASNAVNGMRNAVSNAFSAVVNTMRNLPNTVRNIFSNAGSWLVNAGRNILNGLMNGIRSVINKPAELVKSGIQKIRNLLPFSPAKDGPLSGSGYTLYSGEALIEDFAKGIGNSSPAAIAAMSDAAEAIARETDLSAAIPDFLPADWTASMVPAGVGGSPANASLSASAGAGQSSGTTVQMTNEFTQSDPDEAVAIMWSTLRSAIRSNGGGDIGANPNA